MSEISEIDESVPHTARIYDYLLDGKDHYEADRIAAQKIMEVIPELPQVARDNRGFLERAVTALAELGVDQFVDLGSGLPAADNVHQVARRVNPDARVVYVDHDPIVQAYGRALLAEDDRTEMLTADLRDAGAVLSDPRLRALIDPSRPVAVLMIAVLHFVPDAREVIEAYTSRLAPGSHLAFSAATSTGTPPQVAERLEAVYGRSNTPIVLRPAEEIRGYVSHLEPLPPGLVDLREWRPRPALRPAAPPPIRAVAGVVALPA